MVETLSTMKLRVAQSRQHPPIRQFRPRAANGSALPADTAGAHLRVRVELPGGTDGWRSCPGAKPRTVTVPAEMTILDCLIEHGCDPMFDCKRGECGICRHR